MADSVVNQILSLIMQQGDIEARRIKEEAAWKEEVRRTKNAWKGNTLKALATIGTVALNFIPGVGPFASAAAGAGINAAMRNKPSSPFAPSPGTQPAGLGFNQFAGQMARDNWSSQAQGDPYNPWDDEPI